MDFWSFIGLVALSFVLIRRFLRSGTRAAAGAGAGAGQAPRMKSARVHQSDFREQAAAEPRESEWLRPEPSAEARRTAAEREAQTRNQRNARREPERVEERATVVLRKQIPPRDEPPRSWIGGLPMMLEDIAWPRWGNTEKGGHEEEPCHFICQIALADCHPDLWGGLGPREGWLLLFANSNNCEGYYRFIHTRELGPERAPPADIGPIHDGTYTGQTAWIARETVYPRFPVDLVSMPNRTYERDGVIHASPENLDKLLYEGQTVGKNGPYRGLKQPFTWGCVALAARAAIAAMDDPHGQANAERYRKQMQDKLLAPGGFEAHLRSLYSNRPCRMGGYSDGMQHEVGPHPQGRLLLLQMACDDALEMIWGDCGAIYAFISPADLAAGNFDKAEVHLECH